MASEIKVLDACVSMFLKNDQWEIWPRKPQHYDQEPLVSLKMWHTHKPQ
jgi:hypothetical protein